jgi:hypothetical protein
MASRLVGLIVLGAVASVAACVDVPEGIRANFAAPAPQERSNYRPGEHGVARPSENAAPPAAKAAAAAGDAGPPESAGTTTTTAGEGDSQ